MLHKREIYFHEDDYCQQQLLPHGAAAYAEAEIKKIDDFADAHQASDGLGWTDVYVRQEAPVELLTLRITKELFNQTVSPFLPPFDIVYTGYTSHHEECRKTAAWGKSQECALFADWDEDGIICNAWAEFFEEDEASITGVTQAVTALGKIYPLIYVDWAWSYVCDVTDQNSFAFLLRKKLKTIANNTKS
jgi:hypothetical protein